MKLRKVLAVMLLAVLLTMVAAPAFAYTTYYSACRNGKALNVREYPSKESAAIGKIPYGEVVAVEYISDGWATIVWGSYGDAYVQASLLSRTYPGTKPSGSSSSSSSTSSTSYKNFVFTDYHASIVPTRSTGTVTMYWTPSTKGTKMTLLSNGDEVQVLAQTNNWAQVYCEDVNMCGFVQRKFVEKTNK